MYMVQGISQIKAEKKKIEKKPLSAVDKFLAKIRSNVLLNFLAIVLVYGSILILMLLCLLIRVSSLTLFIVLRGIGLGLFYYFISEELVDLWWRFRRR